MRIAVSGKGGVGKTTLAAALALTWARDGRRVYAVDADPDANLAEALGATPEEAERCLPLSHLADVIEERTGARPGAGGMFRLDPEVDDIPDAYSVEVDGVRILRMGTVERGGSGCMCAESVFLRAVVSRLLADEESVVVMDMEAGLEHLGRGTADAVDAFVVVVEPGSRSVATAGAVRRLASDLGVPRVVVVCNKVRSAEDEEYLRAALGDEPFAWLPDSDAIRMADRGRRTPLDADATFAEKVRTLAGGIIDHIERT
ncbi:MAG: AAA family ATPase [Coriobacteriia bacterium]|nr:AAA family ATPase [Coriobacteriia bacterium]